MQAALAEFEVEVGEQAPVELIAQVCRQAFEDVLGIHSNESPDWQNFTDDAIELGHHWLSRGVAAGEKQLSDWAATLIDHGRLLGLSNRQRLQLLRDAHRAGSANAGIVLGSRYETGQVHAPNLERSDQLFRAAYMTYLSRALAGDRWAMLKVGDLFEQARGVEIQDLGRGIEALNYCWLEARHWWLEAAKSRAPHSVTILAGDFTDKLDTIAQAAVVRVADLFEWGKGVARNPGQAVLLYSLAAKSGSPVAAGRLSEFFFQRGMQWFAAHEKRHGRRLVRRSDLWQRKAIKAGHAPTHLHRASRMGYASVNDTLGGKCLANLSSFCGFAQQKIVGMFRDLERASIAGNSSALLIRAYRLVVFPGSFSEIEFLSNSRNQDPITLARSHWTHAVAAGFIPSRLEAQLFDNETALRDISEVFGGELSLIFSPKLQSVLEGTLARAYKDWQAFCVPAFTFAHALTLREGIALGHIKATHSLLYWIALRTELAEIENDRSAGEWRRTLISSQCRSTAFQARVRVIKEYGPSHSIEPKRAEALIEASTRDVGPTFNELGDRGVPRPGKKSAPASINVSGWINIESISISQDGYQISGQRSTTSQSAFVLDEDVMTCLAVVFLDQTEPSLSLEDFDDTFTPSILNCKLWRKVWTPSWLSETELGRTFYYTDYLLGLGIDGRCLFSLKDSRINAGDLAQQILPHPWILAEQCGGIHTTGQGRLTHTPLTADWSKHNLENTHGEYVTVSIPQVTGGVVGSDIHINENCEYENRFFGLGNLRLRTARKAAILSGGYQSMCREFPVYERARQLFGLYAGIYRASQRNVITGRLLSTVSSFQAERKRARRLRLAAGGVDIVFAP